MTTYLCEIANGITDETAELIVTSQDPSLLEDEIQYAMEQAGYKQYWFLVSAKPKKSGRGGARKGAGKPKGTKGGGRPPGSGKWAGQETTIARIPVTAAQNIEDLISSQEQLDGILKAWKAQCENAKRDSSTGKFPRTYDKVLQLIQELNEEVNKLPFIM